MILAGLQKLGVVAVWGALILALTIPDTEVTKPVKETRPVPPSKLTLKALQIDLSTTITLPPPPTPAVITKPLAATTKTTLKEVGQIKIDHGLPKPATNSIKITPFPKENSKDKEKPETIRKRLVQEHPKSVVLPSTSTRILITPLHLKIKKRPPAKIIKAIRLQERNKINRLNSRVVENALVSDTSAAVPLPEKSLNLQETLNAKRKKLQGQKSKIIQNVAQKKTSRTERTISPKHSGAMVREGRVLLRLLEHGIGPTVEIGWPSNASARNKVYEKLRRCHGMRVAVFVPDRGLFLSNSSPRQALNLDTDRYSGFVRQSQRSIVTLEARLEQQIRQRHSLSFSGNSVRLFPRTEDAVLLGGLASLIGIDYRNAKAIRATYHKDGNKLYIENITVDHHKIGGRIDLLSGSCR